MKRILLASSIFIMSISLTITAQENSKNSLITKNMKTFQLKNLEHRDIGNPVIVGTIKNLDNGIEITAGGADIWGTKDEFHFAYFAKTGNFDIVTQIESLGSAHTYTKAGIMARAELTENSQHIYFQVFPNNNPRNKNNGGYEYQYRLLKGGEMKAIYPKEYQGTPEFPVNYPNTWVRLKRANNTFTGYYSSDGIQWKIYTVFTMELPQTVYLGLAVTSHNANQTTTAIFKNIAEIEIVTCSP